MNKVSSRPVVTQIISGDLWAGAEVQVYSLCKALNASEKVSVTAVVFNKGILFEKLEELGIPVSLANERKLGPFAISRSIAAHCREHQSTVVHTHGFKENVLGILGKEIARVPFSVRTVHGNPETAFTFTSPHKWLIHWLDIFLGRLRQQAVIAVSTQLEEELVKLFPGKVHKIFNFVDVEDIETHWPTLPNSGDEVPRIGIVGRLVPVKRVDIFIKTIVLLNRRGILCRGVVIGSGPLEKELQQLAASLQGGDTQIEFKGFVSPALTAIRELDVLLMTSEHEGLPMTLLEALALKIPIVAHNVGGIPEALDGGNCGGLVNNQSPDEYAEALAYALRSNETRQLKATNGFLRVKNFFDVKANARRYERVYTEKLT